MTTLQTMYPAQTNSPTTSTTGQIDAGDTQVSVLDASVFPDTTPFELTIGVDSTMAETVLVTNVSGNTLTLQRGWDGAASSWAAGSKCARTLSARDLNDVQTNIVALNGGKLEAITIGTVETLPPGSDATVEVETSGNTSTVSFGIPSGETGATGPQGDPGPNTVSATTSTNLTGLLKGNGSTVSAATAGTDYVVPATLDDYATLDSDSKVTAEQASARIVSVPVSKTLSLSDAGTLQQVNSTSARTVTIPTNTSVAFPTGTEIEILRYGSGAVTIAAASGVTITCSETARTIADRYTSVVLKKVGANIWVLQGNVG